MRSATAAVVYPALADGRLTIKIRHLLSHTAGLDYRLNQPPQALPSVGDPGRRGAVDADAGAKPAAVGAGTVAVATGRALQVFAGYRRLARCWSG